MCDMFVLTIKVVGAWLGTFRVHRASSTVCIEIFAGESTQNVTTKTGTTGSVARSIDRTLARGTNRCSDNTTISRDVHY